MSNNYSEKIHRVSAPIPIVYTDGIPRNAANDRRLLRELNALPITTLTEKDDELEVLDDIARQGYWNTVSYEFASFTPMQMFMGSLIDRMIGEHKPLPWTCFQTKIKQFNRRLTLCFMDGLDAAWVKLAMEEQCDADTG